MSQLQRKKLLVWGHTSELEGGSDQDLTDLLEYFSKNNQIELLGTFPDGPRFEVNSKLCCAYVKHRGAGFPILYESFLNYLVYWLYAAKQMLNTRKFIHEQRPDAILFFTSALLVPFIWSLRLKVKRYLFVREVITPHWLMKLFFKKLYRKADLIFTVSSFLRDELIKFEIEGPIHVIYSLPKIETFKSRRRDHQKFKIACVGGISKNKGQFRLIKACHKLNNSENIELHFFGTIHTHYAARRLLKKIANFRASNSVHAKVFFHGAFKHDKLLSELSSFDLIAIPSEYEGLSLVLLEAILLNVPVIASRIGEIQRIIEHEHNGLLFDPHNIDDIANCIDRLRQDRQLYAKIKKNLGSLPPHLGTTDRNLQTLMNLIESDLILQPA